MKKINELPIAFDGKGGQKGYVFKCVKRSKTALMYTKTSGHSTIFEVFEIKHVPICIDFEKRLYSETEFKEVYPRDEHFGKWAWNYLSAGKAVQKWMELSNE